jgi:pseudouridine synthase
LKRKNRSAASAVRAPAPKAEVKPRLKTLDRVLSKAGVASRTEARQWIARGRLKVNGKPARDPEQWVDLDRDKILLDGKPLREEKKVYVLLYKPKGYITTYNDPDRRKTVYSLLNGIDQWVFPVGRLDQDTSGLLLMTNDSTLAEELTNPEYHVPKTYLVKSSVQLTDEQLTQLESGLELNDGPTRPGKAKRLRDQSGKTIFELTITEGRNRQVRRMVEALGGKVLKLVRVAIGPISISGQQIGSWRLLSRVEIEALRRSVRRPRRSGPRRAAESAEQQGEDLAVAEVVLEQAGDHHPDENGHRGVEDPAGHGAAAEAVQPEPNLREQE